MIARKKSVDSAPFLASRRASGSSREDEQADEVAESDDKVAWRGQIRPMSQTRP
jgi:hypothetical protein